MKSKTQSANLFVQSKALRTACSLSVLISLPSSGAERLIYDSLCIREDTFGLIWNVCGGEDYLWGPVDVQTAGDFELDTAHFLTRLVGDFVCSPDLDPESVIVQLYPASSCRARDIAVEVFAALIVPVQELELTPFEDPESRGYGRRIAFAVNPPLQLPPGRWFLDMQPASSAAYTQLASSSDPPHGCYEHVCSLVMRDGGENNPYCDGGEFYGFSEWRDDGGFEVASLSMRVEGIPTGDCTGGESVSAKCRGRRGEILHKIVVNVSNGQPDGAVTALLDPPDPRSVSISLDDTGRGRGKFRNVPSGEHRVFLCDAVMELTCDP